MPPDQTSSLVAELLSLTDLSRELTRQAAIRGAFLVWRAQARRLASVLWKSGKVEEVGTSAGSGHGVHVVTDEGRTALGSRDEFLPEPALALLAQTVSAATAAGSLGVRGSVPASLEPIVAAAVPEGLEAFDRIDLTAVARRLGELEREIAGRVPGVKLSLAYQADLDAWRVVRSDGGDVVFAMPRCVVRLSASSSGDARHTVGASVSGPHPTLLDDPSIMGTFLSRATSAARLAAILPDAPSHPAGSFPLVIDYALAKGLAHEAFGHASEADGFRSSILATNGRFRAGDVVGASHVSIIDEPKSGDHAWQPYSATGAPRLRSTIVDHGRLADALTDSWSQPASGSRLTNADRAESFRSAPLPRMSNIRIEVDAPVAAPGAFEDYGPEEVRDLLARSGVLKRHPRVVFLSGYSGGQVNPATGDFVFNCKAIYALEESGVTLHKPAIFSGSMFGALRSIREGFGPLLLDAIGTCGKWGQSVPSSGGSHYFLALDPDDSVRLGGDDVNLDRLLDAFRAARFEGHAIAAWSAFAAESRRASLGTKDAETGSPHAPITLADSLTARYKLIWDDGRVSRGAMERRAIEREPERVLATARAASYEDPDAIDIPGPATFPEVATEDADAYAIAQGRVDAFAPRLDAIRERVARHGIRTWSGSIQAAHGTSRVVTSSGLDVAGRGTSAGWSATLDGELGAGHGARGLEPLRDLEARLDRLVDFVLALRAPSTRRAPGIVPVLLHPDVVEDYVMGVLLHNLDGAHVAHGTGAFRFEQFGADRPVLRDDLTLRTDPLVPMAAGAYRFSQEGVPARACAFIERGRLKSPLLDLKYARRLGLTPTASPLAMDTLFLEGPVPITYDDALAVARDGALVLSVLGVHTQDFTSGDFSLSAPQTLAVGAKGLAGRLRATISGNLFELLRAPELALVHFPGEHTPGLLVRCRLDPA